LATFEKFSPSHKNEYAELLNINSRRFNSEVQLTSTIFNLS